MKILLLNQYFIPEPGAGTSRVFYYAKFLREKGHDVTVISGVPNYPDGKIHKGYKNQLFLREKLNGIKIYRTLIFPTRYTSNLRRFFNYLVFTISSFLVGLFIKKPDLIIASSPPPSAGVAALLLSYLKGSPLIFEVRDVWPGAAKALGFLKNPLLLKLNLFFESRIYKRAKSIVTVTDETKEIILSESTYLEPEKVKVIVNGADLEVFDGVRTNRELAVDKRLSGKFVVTYTGTLGLQQGVETLIEAANILKKTDNIIFLIIGDGAERGLLERSIAERNLRSIILKKVVPYEEVVSYIKKADIGLTVLKKSKYLDAAYPVKAFDYMAAGKPILVSGGLAMKEFIEKNKIGFWVDAENAKRLAEEVLKISKLSKQELSMMGRRGRALVEKKFNRERQARELEKIINSIKNGR